jgi:hypothetical protein
MIGSILPNLGVTGNFLLGQPVSQVLSRLQSQPKSFGRISIIQEPMTIVVESGFKFSFDNIYQRLEQIDIFINLEKLERKRSQGESLPPDMLICGQSIQGPMNCQEVNKLMGPTVPPNIEGKKSILTYSGVKFVFCQNQLVKIIIINDDFSPGAISK